MSGGLPAAVDVVLLVVVVVLVLVQQSVQLKNSHPMHGVVDRVNEIGGPYVGLLMTYPGEEVPLQASGYFLPNSQVPYVDLAGRRFNIGTIKDVNVIYVMSGEQTSNAAITVQILLDAFDILGVVHYGIAGSTNDSLLVGDVSVLKYVAMTGSWKWLELESGKGPLPDLEFGAFNLPIRGENLLSTVIYTPGQVYTTGQPMKEAFWLEVDQCWFNIATQLQDIKLRQCVNETHCLPEPPKVAYGLRGATANVYLDNAAYRTFLFNKLNVSTTDEESAAVVMTCVSNGVPCVVFRGISDMAGAEEAAELTSTGLSSLAAVNVVKVAVEFIGLIGQVSSTNDQ